MKTDLARGLAFLWLLSLWPAAYFVAGNFDQIADYDFEGVTGILLVSAAVPVAASLLAAALWSLRKRRAAIVVLFASAGLNPLLFCFRSFESTIVKLWAAGGFHHGMMAVYAALCASMALALGFALRKPVAQRAAVLGRGHRARCQRRAHCGRRSCVSCREQPAGARRVAGQTIAAA